MVNLREVGKKGDRVEIKKINVYGGKNIIENEFEIILFQPITNFGFVKKIDPTDPEIGIGVTCSIQSISFLGENKYQLSTDMYTRYDITFT
ncbi:MAG: hypothetical protein WCI91_02205 [Candidatus Nomurabacteria bacterium]